ncbi:MAG TPA: hypothetical protein VGR71_07895 [Nitrospira sp.]|nr:hypothetical protein [Nitrospira sp.]
MQLRRAIFASVLVTDLVACGSLSVRQQDLDAWVGVPVAALDTHSVFITIPMYRTVTASGIEIRDYVNGADIASCFTNAGANRVGSFVNSNAFTTCSTRKIVCNNIFYIKDGKVIEYAPTGRCYTDSTLQPQARYLRLEQQ